MRRESFKPNDRTNTRNHCDIFVKGENNIIKQIYIKAASTREKERYPVSSSIATGASAAVSVGEMSAASVGRKRAATASVSAAAAAAAASRTGEAATNQILIAKTARALYP